MPLLEQKLVDHPSRSPRIPYFSASKAVLVRKDPWLGLVGPCSAVHTALVTGGLL